MSNSKSIHPTANFRLIWKTKKGIDQLFFMEEQEMLEHIIKEEIKVFICMLKTSKGFESYIKFAGQIVPESVMHNGITQINREKGSVYSFCY